MSTTSPVERARDIVASHASRRGPLLPILHAVQEEFGFIDSTVVPTIANELNLSVAEVHGVVSFYRDFRSKPAGAIHLRVCRAEACQAVGGEALADHAADRCGVGPGNTSLDGSVSLDDVFCLGNCALGPSIEINGRLHGRVTAERLDTLLQSSRAVRA